MLPPNGEEHVVEFWRLRLLQGVWEVADGRDVERKASRFQQSNFWSDRWDWKFCGVPPMESCEHVVGFCAFWRLRVPYTDKSLQRFSNPQSTSPRKAAPLRAYELDPLAKPDGYPWHRWARPADGTYALNASKFVGILSRLGRGEDTLGTITPNNYTVGGVPLTPDDVRLGPNVRPYVIRGGTVLRPGGRTGMFVTLVQRAVEKAK